ncbi:hypothetical protein COB64_04600 [Candidatus Wolfebacteria bacterium]|nr:MAG: hypothetical protein COB64_04600 [Candidatus Wolfebacteria bacterium]
MEHIDLNKKEKNLSIDELGDQVFKLHEAWLKTQDPFNLYDAAIQDIYTAHKVRETYGLTLDEFSEKMKEIKRGLEEKEGYEALDSLDKPKPFTSDLNI